MSNRPNKTDKEKSELRFPTGYPARGLILAVFLAMAGCALYRFSGTGERKFSHARHATFAKYCDSCHLGPDGNNGAAATLESCLKCHVADASYQGEGARCEDCENILMWESKEKGRDRLDYGMALFKHEHHPSTACETCHGDVNAKRRFGFGGREAAFPPMEECVACHFPKLREVPSAPCALCHAELNPDTPLPDHKKVSWEPLHGQDFRARPDRCFRCHDKARDCDECHARRRPKYHTAAFRSKTHGFRAMSAPESCQTCHEQDFCRACHETTEPSYHTGSFKRPPYLHCATCHLPLEEGNRCAVCHQGNPHENVSVSPPFTSPPHPKNTITNDDCNQCHL